MFFEQFANWPVALLGISAATSLATGGFADAVVIAVVVLLNASVGYVTESNAERVISSLGKTGPTKTRVFREGAPREVPTEEVVPGDILVLGPATFLPADARLLSTDILIVDESMLTGESVAVTKSPRAVAVDYVEGLRRRDPASSRCRIPTLVHVRGGRLPAPYAASPDEPSAPVDILSTNG